MSLYQKASLVQIPSGYKAADDKLYSIVPSNGDGDFTIDSDADATRVNKDGLIETTVADQARLNYDFIDGVVQPDPHLLLEPTRRNIVDYSEEFNQWTLVSGASVTTNQITSPDGSNTADKITSSASNSRVNRTFSYSNNSTMVFSVFIKNIDATNIKIGISDNVTGVCNATFTFSTEIITAANGGSWTNTSASVQNFGNGWYRLILISTKGAGSNLAPRIEFTESGKNIFAWGAQLEDNGNFGSVDYPTSYIPTAGSAVTRTRDTAKIENFANMPTDYPFTLFWQGRIDDINFSQFAFSILDISSNVKYLGFSFSTTGYFQIHRRNSNYDVDSQTFSMSVGDVLKIAIAFTSNTTYKCYINGSLIRNETSGDDVDFDFNDILIGQQRVESDSATRNQAKQFMLFNETLTDSELEQITSYNSFGQMAKALLYTIE